MSRPLRAEAPSVPVRIRLSPRELAHLLTIDENPAEAVRKLLRERSRLTPA